MRTKSPIDIPLTQADWVAFLLRHGLPLLILLALVATPVLATFLLFNPSAPPKLTQEQIVNTLTTSNLRQLATHRVRLSRLVICTGKAPEPTTGEKVKDVIVDVIWWSSKLRSGLIGAAPTIHAVPPTIIDQSRKSGEIDAAIVQQVEIEFDYGVDASTLTPEQIDFSKHKLSIRLPAPSVLGTPRILNESDQPLDKMRSDKVDVAHLRSSVFAAAQKDASEWLASTGYQRDLDEQVRVAVTTYASTVSRNSFPVEVNFTRNVDEVAQ